MFVQSQCPLISEKPNYFPVPSSQSEEVPLRKAERQASRVGIWQFSELLPAGESSPPPFIQGSGPELGVH